MNSSSHSQAPLLPTQQFAVSEMSHILIQYRSGPFRWAGSPVNTTQFSRVLGTSTIPVHPFMDYRDFKTKVHLNMNFQNLPICARIHASRPHGSHFTMQIDLMVHWDFGQGPENQDYDEKIENAVQMQGNLLAMRERGWKDYLVCHVDIVPY